MSEEKKKEEPEYGYWQRCPACDNNGQIWKSVIVAGYPSPTMGYLSACPVCHGTLIIQRPKPPNPITPTP